MSNVPAPPPLRLTFGIWHLTLWCFYVVLDAANDPVRKLRGRQAQRHRHDLELGKRRGGAREMLRQRSAGEKVPLQRPYHPLQIAWLNARRRRPIDPFEQSMDRGEALPL